MTETETNFIHKEPLLIVISGPSGAGKDVVIKLMKSRGLKFHFVVTTTDRPMRPGEVHGQDYFFVTSAEFARMIDNDELLEYATVYGEFKGIPKQQVKDALASHEDVIIRVDVQGAETVRKLVPNAVLIFLTAENEAALVARLKARKTESPEQFTLRIATARQELKRTDEFDYVVVNKDGCLDETVDIISAIITAEHQRTIQRKVEL